jgi:hypothetical protein
MEHHSNIVPWQMLCERTGAVLKSFLWIKKGNWSWPNTTSYFQKKQNCCNNPYFKCTRYNQPNQVHDWSSTRLWSSWSMERKLFPIYQYAGVRLWFYVFQDIKYVAHGQFYMERILAK